jgi:hypothetical protein
VAKIARKMMISDADDPDIHHVAHEAVEGLFLRG